MSGLIWDLAFLLSLTSFVLVASTKGFLSVPAVVFVALAAVLVRVAGKSKGRWIGHAVRVFFLFALPIASLLLFVLSSAGWDARQITAIAGGVLSLLLVIVGFWVMLKGLFKHR